MQQPSLSLSLCQPSGSSPLTRSLLVCRQTRDPLVRRRDKLNLATVVAGKTIPEERAACEERGRERERRRTRGGTREASSKGKEGERQALGVRCRVLSVAGARVVAPFESAHAITGCQSRCSSSSSSSPLLLVFLRQKGQQSSTRVPVTVSSMKKRLQLTQIVTLILGSRFRKYE